jgi:hypothetical protein
MCLFKEGDVSHSHVQRIVFTGHCNPDIEAFIVSVTIEYFKNRPKLSFTQYRILRMIGWFFEVDIELPSTCFNPEV